MRRVETIDNLVKIKYVVGSVYFKDNLESFAPELVDICKPVILSTGGTYTKLKNIIGDKVEKISEYIDMPETEGGLVKSLHHKLFLGYLTETYCNSHQNDLKREDAKPIDMVFGNFYPFQEIIADKKKDYEDARMNIDIGGPSTLRAAAKNWHRVCCIVDPRDYEDVINEMKEHDGFTTLRTRFELQKKAWRLLATYNSAIADHAESMSFEEAIKPYKVK